MYILYGTLVFLLVTKPEIQTVYSLQRVIIMEIVLVIQQK